MGWRRAKGCAVGCALAVLATLAIHERAAAADPQASVGLTLGAAGEGYNHQFWKHRTAFHMGFHGDVLFGRSSTSDFGIGPYAEVLTHAFDEVQFGGGVTGLLPVLDSFPILLSAGAYGRKGSDAFGVEPGVTGQFFWGSRSHNFHANYVVSGGLLAQLRYGLGPSHETSIVIGAQIDVVLLALPIMFLVTAARGPSREAAPVR
jgi:hypothetical protein